MILLAAPIPVGWFAYRRAREAGREAAGRIELEKALAHSRKLESLGTLAGGVAHELNSQLLPIMTMTEIVRNHMSDSNSDRKKLDLVLAGAEAAKRTVSKILDYARAGEDVAGICDATRASQAIKEIMKATCPSSIGLEIAVEEAMGDLPVSADEFQSILINLFSNAVGAMENKSGTLSIAVSTVLLDTRYHLHNLPAGHYAKISVRDSGEGISPADRERVFDPFYSTKEVGKGIGIGLAIVHGIVTSAGGSIQVESEQGEGSIFTVLLPVRSNRASTTKHGRSKIGREQVN